MARPKTRSIAAENRTESSLRDVVEETSLGSLSDAEEGETQTFALSDQLSHTDGGTGGQTFVDGVFIGQARCVFIAGSSQSQGDRMEINSQNWITKLADDESEDQAMARSSGGHRRVGSGAV